MLLFASRYACYLLPLLSTNTVEWKLPDQKQVEQVASAYVAAAFQGDAQRASSFLAEDFFFIDQPGEIFGGGLERGIRGRDKYLAVEASWGIEEISFKVKQRKFWGGHAIFAGDISWRTQSGSVVDAMPFATVLEVRGDKLVGRRDFGDYDSKFSVNKAREEALMASTKDYLAAYQERDFMGLEEMLKESVRFEDMSARWVESKDQASGRDAFLERLERVAESITDVSLKTEFSIYSGRHVFLLGEQQCNMLSQGKEVRLSIPVLTMLEFDKGKLSEHLVYADQAAAYAQLGVPAPDKGKPKQR